MEHEAKRLLLCVPCEATCTVSMQNPSLSSKNIPFPAPKGTRPNRLAYRQSLTGHVEAQPVPGSIGSSIYNKTSRRATPGFSPAPGLDGLTLQRARSACRLQVLARTRGPESA